MKKKNCSISSSICTGSWHAWWLCGNNAQPAADSTKAEENSMDTSAG